MDSYTNDMTFRDYLRILFRQKSIIILCFLVVCGVSFVGLTLKTPVYTASVKMLISAEKQVEAPYYQELAPGQRNQASATQSEVVTSSPVIERAVTALRLDQRPVDYERRFASPLRRRLIDLDVAKFKAAFETMQPEQKGAFLFRRAVGVLKSNVSVETIHDTNLFRINVSDFDPVAASVIANVVSRSYVIFDLQQQMAELELKYGNKHPTVLQLRDNVQEMISILNGKPLPDDQAIGPASVKILEQASMPFQPKGPSKKVVFVMAALMGLFMGSILAFIFEFMDQTVKTPRELEQTLGLAHLGSIPRLRFHRKILLKDMKNFNPRGAYPSALISLADQIRVLINSHGVKTILFMEPEKSSSVSGIVADLGFCLSDHGDKRVLVVGANYRVSPKVRPPAGLVDVLTGKIPLDQAIESAGQNLWMLGPGYTTLNPMTFLDSAKAKELFLILRSKFDLILVEGPDLKNYKESLILAGSMDGVILMLAESITRLPVVKWALKPLKERKCHVLGAILNRRKYVIPKFIYDRV